MALGGQAGVGYMIGAWPSVKDGVATGLALAAAVTLACRLTGHPTTECGGWLFVSGAGIGILSSIWTIVGYHSPPGLLGILSGSVEIYPSARRNSMWLDRFVSPRNVWLVAGAVMVVVSLLPPYLRI